MFRGSQVRVVLVLLLLLRPEGFAKPSPKSKNKHRQSYRKKTLPAWKNPCKIPMEVWKHYKSQGRHANSSKITVIGKHRASPKPLRRLRTQMNTTLVHFDQSLNQFNSCNQVNGFDVGFDWLPQDQLQWYKQEAKCLDKKTKVMLLLPRLHEGLQVYCACFERLRQVRPTNSETCSQTERACIFSNIGNRLNQLLCEVDLTIKSLKMSPPHSMPEEVAARLMPSYGLSETSSDLTERGVITAYGTFIKDWHRIVRNLVGKKGDRRCTHHHPNSVHHAGLLYAS